MPHPEVQLLGFDGLVRHLVQPNFLHTILDTILDDLISLLLVFIRLMLGLSFHLLDAFNSGKLVHFLPNSSHLLRLDRNICFINIHINDMLVWDALSASERLSRRVLFLLDDF